MTRLDLTVENELKQRGYSITSKRIAVFEVLEKNQPLTMNELYLKLKDKLDRASLYRTIALFEQLGIIHRIYFGWKYKIELSERFLEHHHHLSCTNCHKIIPINESKLESFIDKISNEQKFLAKEHLVEIQGVCSSCINIIN